MRQVAHLQVIINCQYSIAQMCTLEDLLAHYLGAPSIDDVIRQDNAHNSTNALIVTNNVLCG